ncbi:MAG: hypothetical protein CBE47_01310 [Pelagibacteraceae bacterium TMED287]|nr:MAG: hypothetical protein CBE47_01310 [Pelagibacteraceae bacterium TMED287]|tara:strand:+ start:316 stop:2658 length:2343 start_codon:yes stop_codon:yes gene_type:complete
MNINVNNELKKVREKEINDILEYAECGLTVKEIVEVTNYDITYVNDIIKNSPLQINEVTTNYKQVAKDIQKMMKKDRMKFISTKDIQDYVDNNADSPHKVEIDRIESELKKLRVSVVDKFPQRREELDKEDEPTVQKVVQMLKKASKAHAGQAKELEKAVKEEIDEQFSKSMIDKLRKTYGPLKGKKIPPEPLAKIFDKIDRNKNALIQLYKADIPFVSTMAMTRLMSKHNMNARTVLSLKKATQREELFISTDGDMIEESKMVDVLFKKHPKFKNGWTVVKVNNITDAEKNKAKRDSKNFMYVPSASIRDLTKAKPGDNFEFPQDNDPEGEIVKLREAQAVAGGKVHKFVTGNNITLNGKKYPKVEFEVINVDNAKKEVLLKALSPKQPNKKDMVRIPFRMLRRGPFTKSEVNETKESFEVLDEQKKMDLFKYLKLSPKDKEEVDPADIDDVATEKDVANANKNIMIQLKKQIELGDKYKVEFGDKKATRVPDKIAKAAIALYDKHRTSFQKLDYQRAISGNYKNLLALVKRGKVFQFESYEIGTDYALHAMEVTPGQDVVDYKKEKELKEVKSCPLATTDVSVNTKNRDATTKNFMYGPLNIDEPGDYWEKMADKWDTTVEAAKKSLCGNCVAFDISPSMEECMPGEVSDDSGKLGYCWMHHFKCHSARSCTTWAKGGPITTDEVSDGWEERNKTQSEATDNQIITTVVKKFPFVSKIKNKSTQLKVSQGAYHFMKNKGPKGEFMLKNLVTKLGKERAMDFVQNYRQHKLRMGDEKNG